MVTFKRKQAINKLAEVILNAYREARQNNDEIVTKDIKTVEDMVELFGGKVVKTDEIGEYSEAMVQKVTDEDKAKGETCNFIITVREHTKVERQKFSIAHELGHLFIHMRYLRDEEYWNNLSGDAVYYRRGRSNEESDADEFAGALLMPRAIYRQILDRYAVNGGKSVDCDKVAEAFGVSVSAAATRGRWLGYLKW